MTNIEQKALELCHAVSDNWLTAQTLESITHPIILQAALCRAIERHEAFRQEVSDAVAEIAKAWGTADPAWGYLRRFIITKPDPLVEVLKDADDMVRVPDAPSYPEAIRAALAKRGLEIREKSDG